MNALVLRLALGLALGASATGTLAASHHGKPFSYTADDSIGISGVYQPTHDGLSVGGYQFKIGHYVLDGIRVDWAPSFRSYEGEKQHSRKLAPIMFMFSDRSIVHPDHDEANHELYVLPRTYHVDNNSIAFDGRHPKLGRVTFLGKLDRGPIKAAEAQDDPVTDGSVLKGDLTVGGKLYHDVEFFWFNGDP